MSRKFMVDSPWTKEEDELLIQFRYAGWHFTCLAEYIPGRTPAACATRFRFLCVEGIDPLALDHRHNAELRDYHKFPEKYRLDPNYVFRVPEGDPYLQRLIKYHGNDKINRNLKLKSRFEESESV